MSEIPPNKTAFSKLYRYYCAKLWKKIGMAVFYFLLWAFIITIQLFVWRGNVAGLLDNATSWQMKFGIFWLISFFQLGALSMTLTPLVAHLVGRGLGWEEFKKKELFRLPKISREEDVKVIIFTPGVKRETVIWAKFAATFTYFMVINFLLTFLGFIYFLFFTNFGTTSSLLFLLLNGLGLGLINFLLIIPFSFYQQEGGSFWVYFICAIFAILLAITIYFSWRFISSNPIIFMLASVLFALLTGCLFFTLYWKKYLKNDLD